MGVIATRLRLESPRQERVWNRGRMGNETWSKSCTTTEKHSGRVWAQSSKAPVTQGRDRKGTQLGQWTNEYIEEQKETQEVLRPHNARAQRIGKKCVPKSLQSWKPRLLLQFTREPAPWALPQFSSGLSYASKEIGRARRLEHTRDEEYRAIQLPLWGLLHAGRRWVGNKKGSKFSRPRGHVPQWASDCTWRITAPQRTQSLCNRCRYRSKPEQIHTTACTRKNTEGFPFQIALNLWLLNMSKLIKDPFP
jgi:hypothetical protein